MASFNNATSPIHPLLSEKNPLLNLLFPGFMPVISSAWPLLTAVPSNYGRLLWICGVLLLFGIYVSEYLRRLVETYFTSTIHVPYSDEAYDMLISWVSVQPFARSACTSLVTVNVKPSIPGDGPVDKKPLHYSPCNGRSYFWHKRNLFIFTRTRSQDGFGCLREEVTLAYFGRDPGVLRELLGECRRHYMGLVKNKTCVFEHENDRWKSSRSRSKRDAATVVIKEDLKKKLIDDIAEFLDPQTRSWYYTRSLPYQRGYLFYGPPGTGKSSFSLSIAGRFDLDLYVLSVPSLSDRNLRTLFAELPQQCVVLLEDVDAVGLDRSQGVITEARSDGGPGKPASKVSLSTLLNVLDGIGSSEGRVLIMTTNHIEHLDPALIRPGRADMRVEFQLADRDMISQLFFFVYGSEPANLIQRDGTENSVDEDGKVNVTHNRELCQMAKELAAKMPEYEFSPAEIMSLLLANKHLPRRAVADVGAWMERSREERRRLSRANSWALTDEDAIDHP
ncbi:mitochondrial chaperone bcs1 [Paraphaeosphaeria sporulosa]